MYLFDFAPSVWKIDWANSKGPLLETFIFFEISYGSYQPLNFLPNLQIANIFFMYIEL